MLFLYVTFALEKLWNLLPNLLSNYSLLLKNLGDILKALYNNILNPFYIYHAYKPTHSQGFIILKFDHSTYSDLSAVFFKIGFLIIVNRNNRADARHVYCVIV